MAVKLLQIFGHRGKEIVAKGHAVAGTVTNVKTCWWMKVNTKPVRANGMDGARFPHIVEFSYTVDGTAYSGSRYLDWTVRQPAAGEYIRVYIDPERPERYALDI